MSRHTGGVRVPPQGRAYAWVVGATTVVLAVALSIPLFFAHSDSGATFQPSASNGAISVGGGSGSPAPAISSAAPVAIKTSGPRTASDQGVTATTIKVGVVLLDLAPVSSLGLGLPNYETSFQMAGFNAYFDKINQSGGIYGRKIVPVYLSSNPLSSSGPGSSRAICLQFAKDEKVFAVLGVSDNVGACTTIQYQVPYIGNNALSTARQFYTQSRNYLITTVASAERTGQNWAAFLVKSGTVTNHKVGMLNLKDGGNEELAGNSAEQIMKQLGHPLTYRGQLPNDTSGSASVVPQIVQNMKSSGVDQVMLCSSFAEALGFMAVANQAHYFPQYLTSDIGSLASDGLLSKAPPVFNGAIAVTSGSYLATAASGEAEPADRKACRTTINAATGKSVKYGEGSPAAIICSDVEILRRGTLGAGIDLTRAGFVAAIQRVGKWQLPGLLAGLSAPGRTDLAAALQPLRWLTSCQCYHTAGSVFPDPY